MEEASGGGTVSCHMCHHLDPSGDPGFSGSHARGKEFAVEVKRPPLDGDMGPPNLEWAGQRHSLHEQGARTPALSVSALLECGRVLALASSRKSPARLTCLSACHSLHGSHPGPLLSSCLPRVSVSGPLRVPGVLVPSHGWLLNPRGPSPSLTSSPSPGVHIHCELARGSLL